MAPSLVEGTGPEARAGLPGRPSGKPRVMAHLKAVPDPEPKPAALIQSVDRAISVLELLAKQGRAGITEIAEELGVHKSTASRLVSVLENRGLVEQLGERGKYALGFASPGWRRRGPGGWTSPS